MAKPDDKQRAREKQTRSALRKLANPGMVFGDKTYFLTPVEPPAQVPEKD